MPSCRPFVALTIAWLAAGSVPAEGVTAARAGLPTQLGETGLYLPGTQIIAPGVLEYSPQYPLWSDAASKRRWFWLPPGTAIDVARPDRWEFPVGTKLWKEFSHDSRVETRLIERLGDGSWRYASYVWNAAETEARLAPAAGMFVEAAGAPDGRYTLPAEDDCRACHEAAPVPVLGISALQLSPDRDPLAPHAEPLPPGAVDLGTLAALGSIVNLPAAWLDTPPRALGYLHANCGHCHNDAGPLALLDLSLAQTARSGDVDRTYASLLDRDSDLRLPGADRRVVAGDPMASVLWRRMRSRHPIAQMPPLGTVTIDAAGVALIEQWIRLQTAEQERSQ